MFPLQEAEEEDSPEFSWGAKKGRGATNKDIQFYKSFTYKGVEFNLYDCVYMCRRDEPEPDIGKIVKMWESETRKRIVKVVWFFRPAEVTHWLNNIKVLNNELLLASGEGIGLSNINPVVIVPLILFQNILLVYLFLDVMAWPLWDFIAGSHHR